MFLSLINTLALFGVKAGRFDFLNIATERGENPTDVFYLCETPDADYVVYETDYIDSLRTSMAEGLSLFDIRDDEVEGYIMKGKDAVRYSVARYPHSKPEDVIVDHSDMKYAVLKVRKLPHDHAHDNHDDHKH